MRAFVDSASWEELLAWAVSFEGFDFEFEFRQLDLTEMRVGVMAVFVWFVCPDGLYELDWEEMRAYDGLFRGVHYY